MRKENLVLKYSLLLTDVSLTAVSPIIAQYMRDNLEINEGLLETIEPYLALNAVVAGIVFLVVGVHRGLWRYASLSDLFKVAGAATAAILITLFLAFIMNRLDGVARSIPVIQWFVVLAVLCATRIVARVARERARRRRSVLKGNGASPQPQNVIVVGVNAVTELYLGWLAEYAPQRTTVVGILAEKGAKLRGRQLMFHKILGDTEEILMILLQHKIHGITIDKVVLATPFSRLSEEARSALLDAEKMGVTLDFLEKKFDLFSSNEQNISRQGLPSANFGAEYGAQHKTSGRRWYAPVKVIIDVIVAVISCCVLTPVVIVVALIVVIDVGWPIVFWQQRLGKNRKEFKLFKFRTMSTVLNKEGNVASDDMRTSKIGKILRRMRLDELPQLYNILIGEMSFVGPRPLLASEQVDVDPTRLLVRPGLTGWAQINGGREVSTKEKVALDMWYVRRISPQLDVKIIIGTFGVLLWGDRRHSKRVRKALNETYFDGAAVCSHAYPNGGEILKSYFLDGDEAEREGTPLCNVKPDLEEKQRAA
jgi:lipopolysaccharide/colanic/teichoic acid biosynthesis glycosyltransferase